MRPILNNAFLAAALSALAAAVALVAGPACAPESRPVFKLGILTTLSGPYAHNGQSVVNAAVLAGKRVMEQGGLDLAGRKYEPVLEQVDNEDTQEGTMNGVRALVYNSRVSAVVGPLLSTYAIPAARVCEKARVPMISPLSTNPETTLGKEFAFRAVVTDSFQGKVTALFAYQDLGARRAAVIFDEVGVYNRGIARIFKRVFEAQGGEVVAYLPYPKGRRVFARQLQKVRESGAQVLFAPNYEDDVLAQVRQARRLGIDLPILGADGWNGRLFATLPEFEDTYFSHHWHPDMGGKKAMRFSLDYARLFGEKPDEVAALAFDAVNLVFDAASRAASTDPAAIRKALAATSDFTGVSGPFRFDASGDPQKAMAIMHISQGRVDFHKAVGP